MEAFSMQESRTSMDLATEWEMRLLEQPAGVSPSQSANIAAGLIASTTDMNLRGSKWIWLVPYCQIETLFFWL